MEKKINVCLALQQRVLPSYRVPFFDALAAECRPGMHLLAGQPRSQEGIESHIIPQVAAYHQTRNIHILSGALYLYYQRNLMAWLKKISPGVLILEANPRYLNSFAVIHWMKTRHLPVIGWGAGSHIDRGVFSQIRNLLRRVFINRFDALIAYSSRGAREYQALGFPAQKIFVAPNATVARPIHAPPQRPQTYFVDRPKIIFVGRLQARKRVDDLIHACAAMPADRQPVLTIIGDGPMRSELQAIAQRDYPLANFTGAMHGSDLDRQFASADLFVLPGTGGLAVQQAMSFALPVIVGQSDGTQEDLVRSENGWCLTSGGVPALTQALLTALEDVERLRRMGLASYRIVRDEINLENMVSMFVEAVNSVGVGP